MPKITAEMQARPVTICGHKDQRDKVEVPSFGVVTNLLFIPNKEEIAAFIKIGNVTALIIKIKKTSIAR